MSTSHIRSIAIAGESAVGNVDASTGIPTTNGLTFIGLECERASLETFGDAVLNERAESRDGPHGVPPEPETLWLNGARVRRRVGTITLTMPIRPLGTGGTAITGYSNLPMFQCLASGMWDSGTVAATSDTTGATVGTVNEFTAGSVANYRVGDIFGAGIGNRLEVSSVTDIGTTTIRHSPAVSTTLTSKQVRNFRTLYVDNSLDMSTAGSSVAMRIDGVGWRTYAYGCRAESVTFNLRGKQAMAEVTMRALYVTDDHANASRSEPDRTDGAPVHFVGSYAIISSSTVNDPVTAPTQASRHALNVDEFEVTLTNTLTPQGLSDNILTAKDLAITNVEIAAAITLSCTTPTVASDMLGQSQRQVMIGLNGEMTAPNTIAVGNGAAIFLPAGYLTTDPSKYDLGTDIVRQVLNYAPGRFAGDNASANAANSMFRVGLGE